jgi:YebC/PmpR family DNA-binding regulatory protein
MAARGGTGSDSGSSVATSSSTSASRSPKISCEVSLWSSSSTAGDGAAAGAAGAALLGRRQPAAHHQAQLLVAERLGQPLVGVVLASRRLAPLAVQGHRTGAAVAAGEGAQQLRRPRQLGVDQNQVGCLGSGRAQRLGPAGDEARPPALRAQGVLDPLDIAAFVLDDQDGRHRISGGSLAMSRNSLILVLSSTRAKRESTRHQAVGKRRFLMGLRGAGRYAAVSSGPAGGRPAASEGWLAPSHVYPVGSVPVSEGSGDRSGSGHRESGKMAGHSKWANIQHRKSAQDAKRARRWTKILKEVTVAARLGGGDAVGNPRLRAAIQDARADNVPNDTIERAVLKGTGELEGQAFEEITYEGYGPGGVAVLVEAATDNRNRTAADIRHLFSRHGGSLGESGCVAWMFDQRGYFAIDREALDEEAVMELAVELGVDDLETEGEEYELYTARDEYGRVREDLERRAVPLAAKELAMVPSSSIEVSGDDAARAVRLLEALEDHEDVQKVWANLSIDESAWPPRREAAVRGAVAC